MAVSRFDSVHGDFFLGGGVKGLHQSQLTFYVARATSAKFGLHAGNMKFSTQTEV